MEPRTLVVLLLVFASTGLFAYIGLRLFTRGWESYEKRYVESTERSLDSVYLSFTPQQIVYLSLTCSLVVGVLTVIFAGGELIYGVPAAVPAFFVPRVVIFLLKKKRDRQFSVQLVDSLVMMGNSLRAGLSLQQAVQLIPREMQDPIRQEFRITVREMQLGLTEEDALKNLYVRMPTEDVDLFVTAVSISRDIGGNLTEVFDNIADTIRERFRIEGRIRALTAQGKAQGMVMCVLPIAAGIFINIFNPGWMRPMFSTVWGWGMIGLIVILEALGAFFIYKIVSIDV
jgi:tight adherence protein B